MNEQLTSNRMEGPSIRSFEVKLCSYLFIDLLMLVLNLVAVLMCRSIYVYGFNVETVAEIERCHSSSANAAKDVSSLRTLLCSPHSAVRLKSRRPLTLAVDTTTSPPPAAAGSGKTPRNTTETRHLTPSVAFHSHT